MAMANTILVVDDTAFMRMMIKNANTDIKSSARLVTVRKPSPNTELRPDLSQWILPCPN